MTGIIILLMIEEAYCQGSFQTNLNKACTENNFTKFKYEISHDAAVMFVRDLSANPTASVPLPKPKSRGQTRTRSLSQGFALLETPTGSRSLKSVRDMHKHLANTYDVESDYCESDVSGRPKRPRLSPNKTTNQGTLNDIRCRLEEQTYIINTEKDSEISTGIEEISVKDLLTIYETSNSELSATRRQVIEALLSQAIDMDQSMTINANIIRVREDFS